MGLRAQGLGTSSLRVWGCSTLQQGGNAKHGLQCTGHSKHQQLQPKPLRQQVEALGSKFRLEAASLGLRQQGEALGSKVRL